MPEVLQRGQILLLRLDQLASQDIDDVTRSLPLSPVPSALEQVVGLLARSIDAFVSDLGSPDREVLELRERLDRASKMLSARLAPNGTSEARRAQGTQEVYAGLLRIAAAKELRRTPLAVLGAAYVLARLDDNQLAVGPVRAIGTAIRRRAEWIRSDDQVAGVPRALSLVLQAARARVECAEPAGAMNSAAFNALLQQHLHRARDFADRRALAGARAGTDLHSIEVLECGKWLRAAATLHGDDAALVAAAVVWIGLPIGLALALPLVNAQGFAAHIDLERGTVQIDLQPLLAALAKAAPGSAATSDVLTRPLPTWLLDALRRRVGGRSGLHLRHLLGRQMLGLRSRVGMAGDTKMTVSVSRLMRSRARPLLDAGLDASIVSYSTLDLRTLAKATRHYCHVSHRELNEACERWSQGLGWGSTVPLTAAAGIGSRVSPTDETVQACVAELLAQVEGLRPGRRSSVTTLVKFHNVFTGYMAFMLALLLGLRDRTVYDLGAQLLSRGSRTVEVRDKSVRSMPHAILSAMATQLLRLWHLHCLALRRRLKTVQQTSPGLVQVAWMRWLDLLLQRGRVPLLATLQDTGVRPAGARDWKQPLAVASTPILPKADFGRHWLPGVLRAAGMTTTGIERALRHVVYGHEACSNVSGAPAVELECEVAAAIDAAVVRLGLKACHGLTRWPS